MIIRIKKLFLFIMILISSGCHTTGHNPYGDSEVFNTIIITIAVGLLT